MRTTILSVGNESYILVDNILSIGGATGNFTKTLIKAKKEEGKIIDFRLGKSAKSIIYLKDGYIALSIIGANTLRKRLLAGDDKDEK